MMVIMMAPRPEHTGALAPSHAKDEHRTAFFGEDVHIPVPALDTSEVLFKPRVEPVLERVLLRNRTILDKRAKLNVHISHLILEDVGEEDEGTYVVKNSAAPADVRRIILVVRDCALETVVKYGDTYHIPINPAIGPYTLEFRPGALTPVNQTTEEPPVLLLNQTGIPMEKYENRLTVGEKRVNLLLVTGADEGSYTIKDSDEKVRLRACLNVKDHQIFEHLNYGETLKIKLHVDHTKVKMVYIPDSDHKERLIMDQGELTLPVESVFEGRASVEGSIFYLKKIKVSDMGVFRVMDFSGFRIADVYLHVEPYKLPQLYVAIISLLSLLAFLLLVCLLSCVIKVHRRAERARKISLIAQQAGKGDGEAFRQLIRHVELASELIGQSGHLIVLIGCSATTACWYGKAFLLMQTQNGHATWPSGVEHRFADSDFHGHRPAVYINQHLFWGLMSVGIGRLNPAFGSSRSASSAYQKWPTGRLVFNARLHAASWS
ncbi:hypothetical protein DPX16_4744 [Anabarilius grahami]|uniref:Uncharacterized protein n=1 Tax=Anabarilius grahami TaxID=495550 RepID=A0A3N0YJ52_ANAGA|nr:hypothetical protein DPX16_4744 [Anabarilius grahami]